jgi:hypothetical protein
VTADNASFLSAALFFSERYASGFCFARQAWEIQPSHKYAGVNVLRCLKGMDRVEEASLFLSRFQEKLPSLDAWGQSQVSECQSWIKEQKSR